MIKKKSGNLCPVCGGVFIARGQNKIFQECRKCGVVENTAFFSQDYGDTYFNEEYENQYGKSYEDDFSSIYNLSKRRIELINILSKNRLQIKRVCDIGSALGFFLKACSDLLLVDNDCIFEGVEISQFASEYCREKFAFPVFNGSLEEFCPAQKYQLITSWFCLEHMEDPMAAIDKVSGLLEKGGLAAFSLPSPFGPGWKFRREEWIQNHPADHSYDFTPRSVRIMLKKLGFTDIIIRPAAVHPERIIPADSRLYRLFAPVYRFYSELRAFSDTIEVFARRC